MHAILQFHKDAGGAFQGTVVMLPQLLAAMTAGAILDDTATMILKAVTNWFRTAATHKRGSAPLCFNLDCNTEFFGDEKPLAFALALPFAGEQDSALVAGICNHCLARGEDPQAIAIRGWQKVWPELTIAEPGRA
jgi:hypothetical protein